MIDSFIVEQIQSYAKIYEVVSDFISLKKRGTNYVGLCPFHEDTTPSFYVSPSKNICKCFSCGEGGTPIHFIMKHEQYSYEKALKYLAKKYGIEIKDIEIKYKKDDKDSMFILNNFAQKTFSNNLFNTVDGRIIGLAYFKQRNFSEETIKKFQLGYANANSYSFAQIAIQSGYNQKYLEKTGLVIIGRKNGSIFDRFRGRVIFPIHGLSGKIVGFGGRTLKSIANVSKYINSPESDIYHKSNELYGIYFARQAILKQNSCFLVEGYTDVISMHQAGIENVVASCGTALTYGQIYLIRRFTNYITIIYDKDVAGEKATIKGIDSLLIAGFYVKIVSLPEGEDPDSFTKKQSVTAFREYIKVNEVDFIHFKLRILIKSAGTDPIKKAHIITEISNTISLISEEILRLMYVKDCSCLLGVEECFFLNKISEKKQLKSFKPSITVNDNLIREISPFHKYEREIMYYVVRYGDQFFSGEKNKKNVIHLIFSSLKEEDIELQSSVYKKMLQKGYEEWGKKKEAFNAEYYFKYHSELEISQTAFYILTDKYGYIELNEEKKSIDGIYFAINNYKNVLLDEKIKAVNRKLKEITLFSEQKDVLLAQKELQKQKQYLAKLIGNRTLIVHNIHNKSSINVQLK